MRASVVSAALTILVLLACWMFPTTADAVLLRRLTTYAWPNPAHNVAFNTNGTMYAACGTNGIRYVRGATTIVPGVAHFIGGYPTINAKDVYFDAGRGLLYVADGSFGLRVFRDTGSGLTQIASTNTPGTAMSIARQGNYLYIADDTSGMQIVDISSETHPVLRGVGGTPGRATDTFVYGTNVYVADGAQGLAVIGVSNPDAPVWLGGGYSSGYAQDLDMLFTDSHRYLALADGGSGLRMFDVSGAYPVAQGTYNSPTAVFGVDLFRNLAAIACGSFGLDLVNIGNPNRLRRVGHCTIAGYALRTSVHQRKIWVSSSNGGVDVIGMSWLPNDYNGDGLSDLAVYQTGTGNWFIRSLGPGNPITFGENWGGPGLLPVPGDYNGDGVGDLAVYGESAGGWFIKPMASTLAIKFAYIFGGPGWKPHWGDYFYSVKSDNLCIYKGDEASNGIKFERAEATGTVSLDFQRPGTVVVTGDYDGDGASDLAIYETSTGNWWIDTVSTYFTGGVPLADGDNWGGAGLLPVSGDYDGDSRYDLAAYDPTTGNWFIKSLYDATPICFGQNWGGPGLYPVPGDYNGDGLWDLAVYQVSTGNWFIRSLGPIGPGNPPITFGQNWGGPGLVPVGMVQ